MGASNAWRKSVIRKAFIYRILAACGVGAVVGASGKSQWQASPPSPPAPPFPSILELRHEAAKTEARYGRKPTHFGCTRETLLDLISTISNVGDYSFVGKDVTVLGMGWLDSPDMEAGRLWCGRAMTFAVSDSENNIFTVGWT